MPVREPTVPDTTTVEQEAGPSTASPSGRPKREKRLPAHLAESGYEMGVEKVSKSPAFLQPDHL
jgi:hypothetical protein